MPTRTQHNYHEYVDVDEGGGKTKSLFSGAMGGRSEISKTESGFIPMQFHYQRNHERLASTILDFFTSPYGQVGKHISLSGRFLRARRIIDRKL